MLNIGKKGYLFGGKKIYPYATGGDYVYLYEEGNKTYRVHEFLSTGTSTLNVEVGGEMDVLVVGGGGGGNRTNTEGVGGGGGGAVATLTKKIENGTYSVTVGGGGAGSASNSSSRGSNGGQSRFYKENFVDLKASGGGAGGEGCCRGAPWMDGVTGGAGGGAGTLVGTGGIGGAAGENLNTEGEWHAYPARNGGGNRAGAGGGGAGGTGQSVISNNTGDGGIGYQWFNGKYYAGGGGGAGNSYSGSKKYGIGGLGGGGDGATAAQNGEPNTGGGGGAVFPNTFSVSANGGSGIVIVRYVIAEKKLWTPSELGSSLQGWWDFSDTSTLYGATSGGSNVTENDSEILRVEDKSGNEIHLPKATNITGVFTGNIAPNILKTNAQNGLSVFEVDKVNNPNPSTYIGGGFGTQNVPIGSNVSSLAAIWIDYAGGLIGQYFGGVFKLSDGVATNGGNYRLTQDWPDSTTVHLWRGMAGNDSTSTLLSHTRVNFGSGAWRINVQNANYTQPTNSLRIFVNGNTTASASADSAGFTSNTVSASAKFLQIGQSTFSNQQANYSRGTSSKLGEIMFVSEDLATGVQTRQKLEGYLAHKWGLTNNLPAGHPYKYEPPYKVEPEEIVTDGLVLNLDAGDYASYPRSGTTWYDLSGGGNNGTLTNGPTYDSANKGSIVFDGTNDYVSVPSFNADSNQALSVFCWFNGSDLTNKTSSYYYSWFVNKRDNGSDRQWQLITRENVVGGLDHRIVFDCWDTTSPTQNFLSILGTTTLSENTWYYGGFVTDGANMTLYLNGSSEGTGTLGGTGVRKTGSRELVIATTAWNYTGLPLNGKIPVVQIYNRALSSTEITQNFNALRGRYGI